MLRFIARIGSLAALAASLTLPITVSASSSGLSIVNAAFVGVSDASLKTLLARIGATLEWHAGSRDVLITTANHTVVAFTVGDRRYEVGDVAQEARYAPYLKGTEPFLPLNELLSALSLEGFAQGRVLALEPLLSSLDTYTVSGGAAIVARAALALHPRLVTRSPSSVTYEFDGVGSTVNGRRTVNASGVRDVVISSSGRLDAARTLLTVDLERGAVAAPASSDDGRDFTLAVSVRAPAAPPVPGAVPAGTLVTAVDVEPSADAFTLSIAVDGDATYAWHRLPSPDDRFWIDVSQARLTATSRDDRWLGHVTGVRVDQQAPGVVRVALSLAAAQSIAVIPSATGVRVVVSNEVSEDAPRGGTGSIGSVVASNVETPLPPPEPVATALVTPAPYHPSYVPTNPRLIVIDPGHGGNDPGSVYHGQEEKTFTLDIARRLRDVLVARGWQVRMTRETDTAVDPDARTDHDELQARDDVANDNGARIFISIHVNWYSEPEPSGPTTYYSKPEDVPLARDVENAVAHATGMLDRGIVKSRLYVTLHARMPAVLIETAFITNPHDLVDLESPQWRERVAEAIADGLEQYARENPLPPTPNQ